MRRYETFTRNHPFGTSVVLTDRAAQSEAEVVPVVGNNLIRFTVSGVELLAAPANMAELPDRNGEFGIPVLFPPNRIKGSVLRFGGRTYNFPPNEGQHHLHGTIREKPWRVVAHGAADETGAFVTSEFCTASDPGMRAYFPHSLIFRFTYRLQDGQLLLRGDVTNHGPDPAPFGLGFHPYFAFAPSEAGDVRLIVPAAQEYILDSNGLITGGPVATPICGRLRAGLSLAELPTVPDHMLVKLEDGEQWCAMVRPGTGLQLRCEFDVKFRFMAIFKAFWTDAACLEPYSCVTDAFNLDLPLEETGAVGLQPGESFQFSYRLYVQPAVEK